MDQINISQNDLLELCRCWKCDCTTYPICTWIGSPCKECFNVHTFCHFDADKQVSKFKNTLADQHEQQRRIASSEPRPLLKTRIEEIKTDPLGDCLYECITRALNRYLGPVAMANITIADLRFFASTMQTEETYQAYKNVAAASDDSYGCVAKTRGLRAFKNVVQLSGNEVGPENCLWGDENTITIFSDAFRLRFVIFDQRGQMIQLIGQQEYAHTILLRLNRLRPGEEHFTLLQFNNETILKQHEWAWLKKNLHLSG